MHRAFTYRLQPTKGQEQRLVALLEVQRELYNAALEERRGAWDREHRRVTKYDQFGQLKDLGRDRPDALAYGTRVCRGTLTRLDEAFAGFLRRIRTGQTPGYPRFKASGRWDSVSWPDAAGWKVDEAAKRLYVQGVGHVRLRLHRPLRGTPKSLTVARRGRHWDLTVFCSEVPRQPLPPTGRSVGIDLGVANLVTTSEGDTIANPRPRKSLADRLGAAQRDKARRKRGSVRYHRANASIIRVKAKEARIRKDHLHKVSRRLVDENDLICHENLSIGSMVRSARGTIESPGTNVAAKSGLNDAISDSGWGTLLTMIAYKAEDAGRTVVVVNPRHTSQRCHLCGHTCPGNRVTQAVFRCTSCGHVAHADVNAARNILRAGLALHPGAKSEPPATARLVS